MDNEEDLAMTKSESDFTLREKKYAKTKLALANEFMNRMKTTRLAEISIKEACQAVEISEGTFYNYFPHKIDLVFYFNKIKLLRLIWDIKNNKKEMDALETIEYVFDVIADDMQEPFLFYEIISLYTMEHVRPDKNTDLTPAEKYYALPDCPGIEDISIVSLEDFFSRLLTQAQNNGQLSFDIPVSDIVLLLISMVVGMPLVLDMKDLGALKQLYRTQLTLLWKGLGIH
jgi:AcrR family transcriptional regulator